MSEAPWRQSAAPPPPPAGHIPATRLKSEISDRKTEPPLCVQNAMLTKDKKPFTYTPGGIDLSEIRSPRMAKRLERNAMSEGVTPSVHPQNQHPPTHLPPSALAAMQPQLPVQVFPSGKIPQLHHHGGAPPPPPPPNNIPPPPKAPPLNLGAPLPTDSFDRPDMTKIIPENPMKLLRKTSGPVIKQDPIFRKDNYNNSHQNMNLNNTERIESKPVSQAVTPNTASSGVGSIYVPPLNQNNTPPATYKQPQSPQVINNTSRQHENSPDVRSPPPYYKRQPSSPQAEIQSPTLVQRQPSLNTSSRDPQTPDSPKPSLSKAPTPWLTQPRQQPEVPKWATNEQSRIIPSSQEYQFPTKQEEPVQYRNPYQNQSETQSSPWPNESQAWQQKPPDQQKQYYPQEQQPWRQKQPEQQPWQQQGHMTQSPPVQVSQKGVQRQVQNREHLPRSEPTERVEVVIVNDPPFVFQHPGQLQQRNVVRQQPPQQNSYAPQYQNQNQNSQGVRIIPIQVEGQDSNGHDRYNNSDGRSFNRQQSWNSNPTQSGSFKVLQRITQTDGEEDDNQIITEHSPKSQHQFPQRQMSSDQQRRLRENGNNNNLNFIQGPPNQQNMARGPQVRTIPIQIESDGPGRVYVPPSEQIVQEPKKYMGSSIPSRSFKMLQAMTGPEECGPGQTDL